MYLEPTELDGEQIKRLRALGVAQFGVDDVEAAQATIADLEAMLAAKQQEQAAAGDKAADAAREKDDADEKKIDKARRDAEKSFDRRINPIKTALAELRALAALAAGNHDEAAERLEEVKDLPRDRKARIQLELENQADAERLAAEEVKRNQDEVQPLATQAYILHRVGKHKEAAEVFEKLRRLSACVDLDVPTFERLAPLAKELGYESDWRAPVEVRDDTGDRPDLDSLGPFAWHPTPAPDWTLPDSEGKPRSLGEYRQGPVIVIFYLGFGCLHCVEQLNKFAPMTDEFADSGIRIAAVSSDDAISLKKSVEACDLEGGFPFPLVSDPDFRVFKAYRAFDDFENQPLHGTFLIDADGLVRWHDISYEPFEDAEFLLKEARRLLHQVPATPAGVAH
jgi:peroxiredoxin